MRRRVAGDDRDLGIRSREERQKAQGRVVEAEGGVDACPGGDAIQDWKRG